MFGSMFWAEQEPDVPIYTVTFSANENNPNMVTKFTAAGWDGSDVFLGRIVINPGVIIGSTSTSVAAMRLLSASFPAGTTFAITNRGRIQGKGGLGGVDLPVPQNGTPGENGGDALEIELPGSTIDNASGQIWSGGGGGGQGGDGGEVSPIGGGGNSDGTGGAGGDSGGSSPGGGLDASGNP